MVCHAPLGVERSRTRKIAVESPVVPVMTTARSGEPPISVSDAPAAASSGTSCPLPGTFALLSGTQRTTACPTPFAVRNATLCPSGANAGENPGASSSTRKPTSALTTFTRRAVGVPVS